MSDSEDEIVQSTLSSPANSDGNLSHSNVDYEDYDSNADSLPWVEFGRPMPEETERMKYRDRVHEQIGVEMIGEIFVCPVDPFLDHYLPPLPGSVDVAAVVEELAKANLLIKDHTTQSYRFAGFEEGFGAEDDDADEVEREEVCFTFSPLTAIGDAIRAILKGMGVRINPFRLALCLNPWLKGGHLPLDAMACKVDGCITSASLDFDGAVVQPAGELCPTDLVVPIALKACRHDYTTNNLQIVVSANHIFNEDARRRFSYGISIEGEYASIWYFSRSHSMKADSFNFIEEPELLVKVLASLFCATEEQLGFDSHITLIPGRDPRTYLYELPADGVTRLESQFFKTTQIIHEPWSNRIAGRITRVWKVVQVKSKDDLDAIDPKAAPLALKDAWIKASADDEYQIQQNVFRDIDTFYADDGWRSHPLLSDIASDDVEDIKDVLENYKNFFSVIRLHHSSEPNKPISSEGCWTEENLFFPSWTRSSPFQSRDTSWQLEREIRAFESKRRCFFVYEHVCTRISDLPTLGDAMDVLFQAYAVLMVMFCAGWVHRDISHGNILAFKEEGVWQVKLSDLEYAKRFPPDSAQTSSAPKTGTPFFMAHEILTSSSLSGFYHQNLAVPKRTSRRAARRGGAVESSPPVIIVHNYQHDLESLWWMALWLVTMRIDYEESYDAVQSIFSGSTPISTERRNCFTLGITSDIKDEFHPSTRNFVPSLEIVRRTFIAGYKTRHPKDVCKREQYSLVCAGFFNFFGEIEEDRDVWGPLPLSNPT